MITSFKLFESNLEIEKICKDLGIEDFQIVDGLVNVAGDVNISGRKHIVTGKHRTTQATGMSRGR